MCLPCRRCLEASINSASKVVSHDNGPRIFGRSARLKTRQTRLRERNHKYQVMNVVRLIRFPGRPQPSPVVCCTRAAGSGRYQRVSSVSYYTKLDQSPYLDSGHFAISPYLPVYTVNSARLDLCCEGSRSKVGEHSSCTAVCSFICTVFCLELTVIVLCEQVE